MLTFVPESHTYTVDGKVYPSITQILQAEGFIDTTHYTEWARDRGTQVHLAIKYDIMGILDEESLDPVIVPYLSAWRKFCAESHLSVLEAEEPRYHPILGYAGTPDVVGTMNRTTRVVVDIKTGQIEPWVALQTAAQALLYLSEWRLYKRFAVKLSDDGTYKLTHYSNPLDAEVWKAVLVVHLWKQNHRR